MQKYLLSDKSEEFIKLIPCPIFKLILNFNIQWFRFVLKYYNINKNNKIQLQTFFRIFVQRYTFFNIINLFLIFFSLLSDKNMLIVTDSSLRSKYVAFYHRIIIYNTYCYRYHDSNFGCRK